MTRATPARIAREINGVFPYKVCINLDRRPERWREMQLKFAKHDIKSVHRFSALDGDLLNAPSHWTHTQGAYGCLQSHLQVVNEARQRGFPSVLIFEDDVVFDSNFCTRFGEYIEQLPHTWDMLFFGALHKDETVRISENISRLTKSNSTYAYAIRDTVFDAFVELNRKAEDVLDNNNFILQEQFNCYCFMPHLAWVETDYSDAQKRVENHWYLQESLVLFGEGVDCLLRDTTIIFAHKDPAPDGRATENLMFLVAYYHFFFSPHIAIVIVEQGAQQKVDTRLLPSGCKYVFLQDDGKFSSESCFKAGLKAGDAERKYVMLSDSDVYLETLDFRANLVMCQRFDGATGFKKIIDLTREDSLHLRNSNTTRGIDITKQHLNTDETRKGYCYFLNRESMSMPEGMEDPEESAPRSPLQTSGDFRVFQSPNHALRLNDD